MTPPAFPTARKLSRLALSCLVLSLSCLAPSVASAQNNVPENWPLKPPEVAVGGQFRLIFLTSTTRNADTGGIAAYNTHVRTAATTGQPVVYHGLLEPYRNAIQALASTVDVDAHNNTNTNPDPDEDGVGVSVYWLGGGNDKIAANYRGIYDGDWAEGTGGRNVRNEKGERVLPGALPGSLANLGTVPGRGRVWTGSNPDGTSSRSGALSERAPTLIRPRIGYPFFGHPIGVIGLETRPDEAGGGTISGFENRNELLPLYGITPLLTVVATPPPTISAVSAPGGDYGIGATIPLTVTFTEAVTVDTTGGTPHITLETGDTDGVAPYTAGTGVALTFTYTVAAGHTSPDLTYATTTALSANGGAIHTATAAATDADLALPPPAPLGGGTPVRIDGVAPTATAPIAFVSETATTSQPSPPQLTSGDTTAATSITLSGSTTQGGPLPAGEVRIYDGTTRLGEATFANADNRFNWNYTDTTLAAGDTRSYTAVIADAVGNEGAPSAAFTLTIRAAATNANLSGLTLADQNTAAIALAETFDAAVTIYTATVANPVTSVTVTATASDNNATVALLVGGTEVTAPIALAEGDTVIEVRVTAEDDATVNTYRLTITRAALSFAANMIAGRYYSYTFDVDIPALTLPEASGGTGALTYTLTPTAGIPNGLTFNPATRVLSGKPTAAMSEEATLTYTVTDSAPTPATDALTFTVAIAKAQQHGFVFANATVNKDTDDSAFTEIAGGGGGNGAVTYRSGNPAVATVDADSGLVTIVGAGTTRITADKAADANHNGATASYRLNITLNANTNLSSLTLADAATGDDIALTPSFNAAVTVYTATVANLVTSVTVMADADSSSATVALLVGGAEVTAPITLAEGGTVIEVRVTAANDDTKTYRLTITHVALSFGANTIAGQQYTFDTPIPALTLPEAGGGTGALTYTLTPTAGIPNGLTFNNPATRVLNGTPTAPMPDAALTYTVTDSAATPSTAALTFTVEVAKAEQPGFGFADATVDKDTDASAFTETASGGPGSGDITYRSGNPAVATVDINSGLVTIEGAGRAIITATKAADANYNEATARYTLTVTPNELLFVTQTIADQTYARGIPVALTLPEASGGTGALTYTLTPTNRIPPGLAFDAATRVLSGRPTVVITQTLTYTVTDSAAPTPVTASSP